MRPMLAERVTLGKDPLRFPLFGSFKIDGLRGCYDLESMYSRTWKRFPNRWFNEQTRGLSLLDGFDGELTVGAPNAPDCLRNTMAALMAYDGCPNVTYWVFDDFKFKFSPYAVRLHSLTDILKGGIKTSPHFTVKLLEQVRLDNLAEVLQFEQHAIDLGYEGIILRDPQAPYKHGRSTLKQGWMLKVKRYLDQEARITGFIELLHNDNEAFLDERGYTKRSTCQDGKIPMNMLGAFQVQDVQTGIQFEIGTGFTEAQRRLFWNTRATLLGKYVTYKSFAHGVKEKPRHPVFLHFRDVVDFNPNE